MEEADIMEKGEESDDVSDGDEMEQDIAHSFSQLLHQSQDSHPHTEIIPNTSSGVSQVC
jgi:glucose-6-phosphate isomerase